MLGGLLADLVGSYPRVFGPGSPLGGEDGVAWMIKWPYALPNLLSASFLFVSALLCFLGLEEVCISTSNLQFLTCCRRSNLENIEKITDFFSAKHCSSYSNDAQGVRHCTSISHWPTPIVVLAAWTLWIWSFRNAVTKARQPGFFNHRSTGLNCLSVAFGHSTCSLLFLCMPCLHYT